jgi:hypothetical protein
MTPTLWAAPIFSWPKAVAEMLRRSQDVDLVMKVNMDNKGTRDMLPLIMQHIERAGYLELHGELEGALKFIQSLAQFSLVMSRIRELVVTFWPGSRGHVGATAICNPPLGVHMPNLDAVTLKNCAIPWKWLPFHRLKKLDVDWGHIPATVDVSELLGILQQTQDLTELHLWRALPPRTYTNLLDSNLCSNPIPLPRLELLSISDRLGAPIDLLLGLHLPATVKTAIQCMGPANVFDVSTDMEHAIPVLLRKLRDARAACVAIKLACSDDFLQLTLNATADARVLSETVVHLEGYDPELRWLLTGISTYLSLDDVVELDVGKSQYPSEWTFEEFRSILGSAPYLARAVLREAAALPFIGTLYQSSSSGQVLGRNIVELTLVLVYMDSMCEQSGMTLHQFLWDYLLERSSTGKLEHLEFKGCLDSWDGTTGHRMVEHATAAKNYEGAAHQVQVSTAGRDDLAYWRYMIKNADDEGKFNAPAV